MLNRQKRTLSALLSAALAVTALSGCGSTPAQSTGTSDVTTTASVSEVTTAAPEEETAASKKAAPAAEDENPLVPVFEDGMAQPVFNFKNLRDAGYSNEGSDILRYCVYVETDHDTDGDGKADLVKVLMQVPRSAAEGSYKAATIFDPTPYGVGTQEENAETTSVLYNPVPFDYSKLYEPGEKRTAIGSVTTLDAAEAANQKDWNYTVPYSGTVGYGYAGIYDYYLIRGFAVAEASGIGTYGSEGFELCGLDLERDAQACVVEWLTGDRVAYTDRYNNIEIKATDWSNGNVAMTGCSYGGTLPYEVATTGVKGLKTIIPVAGIASWYDYTNSQGVHIQSMPNYADYLAAYNCGAAFIDDDWTVLNDEYGSYLWQMSEDQGATNGDYGDIWELSDYTLDTSKINCSALIVQGLNDFNVTSKQADFMARAFAEAGKPFKLVLHQDGHYLLNGIMVDGMLWEELMNKWLSHYLYDIDNGIEDLPTVSVQSNVDGSFINYDTWNEFDYTSFGYDTEVKSEEKSTVSTAKIAHLAETFSATIDEYGKSYPNDMYYLTLPEDTASAYTYTFPDNYNICGVPEVRVRMSTPDAEKDGLMISALLIDTIDGEENFKAYMTKERLHNILPRTTVGAVPNGSLGTTPIKEFVKSNTPAKLIDFGYTDLQNYGGGYYGRDYRTRIPGINANEFYDYTIYLQPLAYTVEPGHKLVLVITGWDPLRVMLDEDHVPGADDASDDSYYTYSFTIDNSSLDFRVPTSK